MIRRSYGQIAQHPFEEIKPPVERSRQLFANVEELISSRPPLAELPDGDPYVRLAVLECRRRGWGTTEQILSVRDQLMERAS